MKTLFEKMRDKRRLMRDHKLRTESNEKARLVRLREQERLAQIKGPSVLLYPPSAPQQTYVRIVGPEISPWKRLQLLMQRL